MSVPVAPTWAVHTWDVALLDIPRQRCRFHWSAHSMYDVLGMDTYDGVASRWVYDCSSSFRNFFARLGLAANHILRGKHGNAKAACSTEEQAFMPWPTVSTTGVLCLLSKFATQVSQARQSERSRMLPQSARFHLQSLLTAALCTQGTGRFQVEVRFLPEWIDKWPASQMNPPDVVLVVDSAGMVDVSPWADFLRDRSPSRVASRWWQLTPQCGRA